MLSKLILAIDLTLITMLLFFASQHYWSGNLYFIVDVFLVLGLSASRIIRWQINKILLESEQQFSEMYQEYLEAMGYDNGKQKEIK